MNRPVSIDRALSDARPASQFFHRSTHHGLAVWAFAIGAALIVVAVLAMESSLPPNQRFELLQQTSVYP